ncbi:porin [Massilia luteola]|uniref:porin n=1 Tax=Massilia luteola TaxID=3081751 RepID=UPI002ACC0667|nr:porin [Massilia sp. Gc5]
MDYVGEAPGGHDIAVFTGQPTRSGGVAWASLPRRTYGRLDDIGTPPGTGHFTLGHQYNFEYLAHPDVGDPFHAGTAGKASNLITQSGLPVDGAVRYYNSQFKHLSTGASWTTDTLGGDPLGDRAWGMSIGFDYGALSLRAAHQNRHVAQIHLYDLAGNNMDAKNSLIAANVRMRWGTAYAAYSANRGWGSSPLYNPDNPYGAGVASTSSTDSRDTLVGVAVPVTHSTTFLASFIHKNDRDLANRDAKQFAIGASYVVSRSTDFYAAFSRTVNTNGTGIPIGGAARPSGSSAVNIGMRHAF